jgi:hypothetical protein
MKFKFCDLAHYSAMNLEGFLNRNKIRFIKDETHNDKIERTYDITIMDSNLNIYAYDHYVHIGMISDGTLICTTKIHITDFSELKIF